MRAEHEQKVLSKMWDGYQLQHAQAAANKQGGGGGNLFSDEDVAAMAVADGIAGFVRIAAELLQATFGPGGEAETPNPPQPHPA